MILYLYFLFMFQFLRSLAYIKLFATFPCVVSLDLTGKTNVIVHIFKKVAKNYFTETQSFWPQCTANLNHGSKLAMIWKYSSEIWHSPSWQKSFSSCQFDTDRNLLYSESLKPRDTTVTRSSLLPSDSLAAKSWGTLWRTFFSAWESLC